MSDQASFLSIFKLVALHSRLYGHIFIEINKEDLSIADNLWLIGPHFPIFKLAERLSRLYGPQVDKINKEIFLLQIL